MQNKLILGGGAETANQVGRQFWVHRAVLDHRKIQGLGNSICGTRDFGAFGVGESGKMSIWMNQD